MKRICIYCQRCYDNPDHEIPTHGCCPECSETIKAMTDDELHDSNNEASYILNRRDDLCDLWDEYVSLGATVYRVMSQDECDEEPVNMANAQVLKFVGELMPAQPIWLYVDDSNGFDVLDDMPEQEIQQTDLGICGTWLEEMSHDS